MRLFYSSQYFSTWRVGAVQQTRRLAKGNHGNHASCQKFVLTITSSRESGWDKERKVRKTLCNREARVQTTAIARA